MLFTCAIILDVVGKEKEKCTQKGTDLIQNNNSVQIDEHRVYATTYDE